MRPRYAFAAVALASVVALAARAGLDTTPEHGPAAPPALLLGVSNDGGTRSLTRIAPVSLRPLPGRRMRLGAPLEAWALSPDGSRLAAVRDRPSLLHLIDVERMGTLGRLRTRARGAPAAVVWPRPGRLWIVLALPECCAVGSTTVVVVDPIAERVVARRRLVGGLVRVAGSPDGPVLLLAPPAIIGPARLVTVDAAGRVEQVPLDGVSAGAMQTEGVSSVKRERAPALAVDSTRRRAYVVSSRPHVVEWTSDAGAERSPARGPGVAGGSAARAARAVGCGQCTGRGRAPSRVDRRGTHRALGLRRRRRVAPGRRRRGRAPPGGAACHRHA